MQPKVRWISCVLMLFLLAGMLFAQSDRATVNGEVKDASGAVIPDVQVTATNVATNTKTTVQSNAAGLYSVRNLQIGTYTLTFTKAGFSKIERTGLQLGVSQVAEINITLPVGSQAETVEVSAAAPILQTESSATSTNMNNQAITELPLNVNGGRSLSSFMFAYVPGVEGSDYDSHINGSLAKSKEVLIDGTSAVAQLGGYIGESQPPMESVEEFQVSTSGIRADEGRTGGGVFRYEMKSGTNAIHGSAFGFLQNQALNANSASNKLAQTTDPTHANLYGRPSAALSDWGYGVGGPIIKNKLFFYTAYERFMYSNFAGGQANSVVPTAAMLGGDLSAMLNKNVTLGTDGAGNTIYQGAIFDPATGNVFVNNQIPTGRFSQVSNKVIALYQKYYQPQNSLVQNNSMPANTNPWYHTNTFSTKIDYNLSERNHLNGSYIYEYYPRILADQGGIWSRLANDGGPMANANTHNTKAPSVRLSDSITVSPNVIQTFRFTFNRFQNPTTALSAAGKWDQALGFGDLGAGNFPKISFDGNGASSWNMSSLGSQFNDMYAANSYIFNDDVSWAKGRHTFRFGAEYRAMQFNKFDDYNVLNLTFNPAQTGDPNAKYSDKVGNAFASFLLGDAYKANINMPKFTYGRRKALSLYVSDDIKVNAKLTLNVDLRWDYNNPYKEKYGHWSNFDPSVTNPVTGLKGALTFLQDGSQSFEKKQYWTNFAPHIGAAYQLTPTTVVRGSFSIFYVPLNLNTWGAIPYGFNPGYVADNQVKPTGQRTAAFNWDNGYPGKPVEIGQNPNFTTWGMVTIDPRALMPGNTQQWNVGVQQELSKDTRLDVSFIRSNSYHLQSGLVAGNQPKVADYQALAKRGTVWNWVDSASAAATAGVPYPYAGFSGQAWMAITPFPQVAATWGPQFYVGSPLGNSDYKALQISVTKRASHGLSLQGSYVLSATHGDVDTAFQELWGTGSIQNLYDLERERQGISSFDQTHVVKGYVTYELPFGHGKAFGSGVNNIVNNIIGGWNVQFGYHYATGTPIYLHSTNSYGGFNSVYANIKPGCSLTTGNRGIGEAYLNTACFSNPNAGVGELGNGTNYLGNARNPGIATEDIGVHKGVKFGPDGRYNFTFRAEFFNMFNRNQLAGPVNDMNNKDFGKITSYTNFGPRTGQLGARFTF